MKVLRRMKLFMLGKVNFLNYFILVKLFFPYLRYYLHKNNFYSRGILTLWMLSKDSKLLPPRFRCFRLVNLICMMFAMMFLFSFWIAHYPTSKIAYLRIFTDFSTTQCRKKFNFHGVIHMLLALHKLAITQTNYFRVYLLHHLFRYPRSFWFQNNELIIHFISLSSLIISNYLSIIFDAPFLLMAHHQCTKCPYLTLHLWTIPQTYLHSHSGKFQILLPHHPKTILQTNLHLWS